MFNLEQSIVEWQKQMLTAGIKTPVPMEELECHLREEIERQMHTGSNAQIAFETAVRQIGKGEELKAEFARTKPLRSILEFELIKKEWDLKWGPVLHLATWTGALLFFGGMVLFKKGGYSEISSAERMSSLAATAIGCLFAYAGLLGYRLFPVIHSPRVRLAIHACGAVLVSACIMFWMLGYLNHLNISAAQVPIGFSWAGKFLTGFLWAFFVPTGAFGGLVLGLERAAYKANAKGAR